MISRRAFYSPEIFVCEASAGTGKTYALAERYVRLILHLSKDAPRPPLYSILAITFTNKAAFEMKERIIRFLKELALGVMDKNEEARMIDGLGLTIDQVRQVSGRIIAEILRGYNYFQVQTIDRFINTLLVTSAFQIGLTAGFKIRTDAREYLELAIDELIEAAGTNAGVKAAFDDMLTSLLLVEARCSWIPKDVVFDVVEGLFNEYNTYARPFVRGDATPADILKLKIEVVDDVRAFVDRMPQGIHKTVEKSLRKFVSGRRRAFLFNNKLSAYFAKDVGDIDRFDLRGWHLDQWQKIRAGFNKAADMEVQHLYDPYVGLFERAREKLAAACRKDDVVFLGELNARARQIYQEGVAPEELYYRLSMRFEHYLFDEFQDTSLLQWENLRPLPEDAISKGGSLFYVGDKKQAIFSFRGGDTALFDAIRAQYSDPGYHPFTHVLSESRRSQKAIVEFNNAVFSMENLKKLMAVVKARPQDFDELERVYGKAAQVPLKLSPAGCVRVEFLGGKVQEESRARAVARTVELLREMRSRFEWKEIGVLVRKNSDVAVMTRALLEAGIPAASERTLNIKEHPLVTEAAAFLRFLDAPVDNEAFAGVILGDLFLRVSGIPLPEIQDMIVDWRGRKDELYLYKKFQNAFPDAWKRLFEAFFRNAGLYPVYELAVSFFRCWGVLERVPDSRGFLMHFLELIRSKENDYPSLGEFFRFFDNHDGEEFFVPAAGAEAVRVTNIHKSKGLEYRAVILPFFTLGIERGGARGSQAPQYVLRPLEEGLKLYHFNEEHTAYSALADEEFIAEKMLAFFNELNTAYVALTRAVCEMVVLIPPKSGNSANLALQLVPQGMMVVGEPALSYPRDKSRDAVSVVEVLPPECRDWLSFLDDEFISVRDDVPSKDRERGIALHEALAGIKDLSKDNIDMAPEVRALLEGFLASPAVKLLFTSGEQVRTEYEVVDRYGCTRRIDRLILAKDSVTVVDFKTSKADDLEAAKSQVREYMRLMRDVYPGRTVRGILAFIREKEVLDV